MATYNRAETTRRLFEAAAAEFALHGVAGARMDRIASAAASSKALIYSYFGDKEALFVAVLRDQMSRLAEAVVLQPDRVHDFVGDLFDFMTANPEVLRLVVQEATAFTPTGSPDFAERQTLYAEKTARVADGQRDGLVDPELDPSFVVLSLMGLVSWFVAAPQITAMVLGGEPDSTRRAAYRAHLVELAKRLVRTPE